MAEAFFEGEANRELASCAATVFGEVAAEGDSGTSRFGPPGPSPGQAGRPGAGQRESTEGGEPHSSDPRGLLTRSTVEAAGEFASWLLVYPQLLPGVLKYILSALQVRDTLSGLGTTALASKFCFYPL